MVQIISVLSQKGGVGKTTIARALGVSLAEKRKNVCILDFDVGQRTAAEWLQARELNNLKPRLGVEIVDASREGFGIETHAPGNDFLIVDAPGWSDEHTGLLAGQSDFVVVPCGASMDDLRPTVRLVYDLEKKSVDPRRILIVLCRVATEAEIKDARDYIGKAELTVAKGVLRELPVVRRAQSGGAAATEISQAKPREEIRALMAEIIKGATKVGKAEHTHEPAVYVYQPGDEAL